MKSTPLNELIARVQDRLTPTERRIAAELLEDPTLLAFGTVSELAQRFATSRPTIVRFATKLGFAGFSDLQGEVRASLSQELLRPSQRIRRKDSIETSVHALEHAMASVGAALETGSIDRAARPIVRARRVWIITGETSRAGAMALYGRLSILRPDVQFVDDQQLGTRLASARRGDVAVVFDFARYRRATVTAAQALAGQGVAIVAVTDGPFSPLAALTQDRVEITVPAVGPFDSSVPAVAIAELLVAAIAKGLRGKARERIDRTEAMWQATDTFL